MAEKGKESEMMMTTRRRRRREKKRFFFFINTRCCWNAHTHRATSMLTARRATTGPYEYELSSGKKKGRKKIAASKGRRRVTPTDACVKAASQNDGNLLFIM